MSDIPDIPDVEDTGSSGEQQASTELILPDQSTPFGNEPIAETIQGLASTNANRMGGTVAANIISASYSQLTNTLQEAKTELRESRSETSSVQSKLADCRVEKAVLKERVSSASSGRHLRNFSIAAGTTSLGIAFQLGKNGAEVLAGIIGIFGALLVLMAWFWPSSEAK